MLLDKLLFTFQSSSSIFGNLSPAVKFTNYNFLLVITQKVTFNKSLLNLELEGNLYISVTNYIADFFYLLYLQKELNFFMCNICLNFCLVQVFLNVLIHSSPILT